MMSSVSCPRRSRGKLLLRTAVVMTLLNAAAAAASMDAIPKGEAVPGTVRRSIASLRRTLGSNNEERNNRGFNNGNRRSKNDNNGNQGSNNGNNGNHGSNNGDNGNHGSNGNPFDDSSSESDSDDSSDESLSASPTERLTASPTKRDVFSSMSAEGANLFRRRQLSTTTDDTSTVNGNYDYSGSLPRSLGNGKGKGKGSSDLNSFGSGSLSRSPGNGKGKGSSDLNSFDQCFESCTGSVVPSAAPSVALRTENPSSKKNSCCRGGVSFVKTTFRGNVAGELMLPSFEGLSNMTVVDPCSKDADIEDSHDGGSSGSAVKFVSCEQCFPGSFGVISDTCDFSSDTETVQEGKPVCLAAIDQSGAIDLSAKMPTNLELYFLEIRGGEEADKVIKTTLHTSCSTPIYAPWAVRLDACDDDDLFYIDLSWIDISSFDSHPVLEFVDAVSVRDPTAVLSSCPVDDGHANEDACCKGGVTFLKVLVAGTNTTGVLTWNSTLADNGCGYDEVSPSQPVRFVLCSDDCLAPFSSEPCADSWDSVNVSAGDIVCLGSWDDSVSRVSFGDNMPTNLPLYFIPDDEALPIYSAKVHTSCSRPVYPPYAQPFTSDCNADEPVDLLLSDTDSLGFRIEFLDGMSRSYFEKAEEHFDENGVLYFDIGFSSCDCDCDATAPPTTSPSSALSNEPTAPLLPGSGPFNPCNLDCQDWVQDNCVFREGDKAGQQCDISGGRRFLAPSTGMFDSIQNSLADIKELLIEEQIKFHDELVSLYSQLLDNLE